MRDMILQGTFSTNDNILFLNKTHILKSTIYSDCEIVGTPWLHVHMSMYMPCGGAYLGHCAYIYGDVYVAND
jgi:hypothetical protein